MSDFRQQAELIKLARLSRCAPESLDFLKSLDVATLRKLRESVAYLVVEDHRKFFSRVVVASKLLPMPLLALIGERSLGPLLCARVAGEMPVPRAIDIAKHFNPPFMAKTALYMETQKICDMTAALPIARVIAVTHELIAMREFIILGDLVDCLPLNLVSKVLATIHNGEALLRSAFYVENPERLVAMLDVLTDSTLRSLIRTAADEKLDLWPHALTLMSVVPVVWQEKLVNMAVDDDDETLASMVSGVARHDLWHIVMPLLDLMKESGRQRLVNLPLFGNDKTIRHLLQAAEQHSLWPWLLPLTPLMNADLRKRVGVLSDELSEKAIRTMAALAHEQNLWAHGLLMAEHMGLVRRTTIVEILADSNDDALSALLKTIHDHRQWHIALPLLGSMSDKAQHRFVGHPFFHEKALQQDIIEATEQHDLWSVMLPLVKIMPDTVRSSVTRIIDELDDQKLAHWINGVAEASHWSDAFDFMLTLSGPKKNFVASHICERDDGSIQHMIISLVNADRMEALIDHLQSLPTATQLQLVQRAQRTSPELRQQLLVSVNDVCLDILLQRLAELGEMEISLFRHLALQLPEEHLQRIKARCESLTLDILLEEA